MNNEIVGDNMDEIVGDQLVGDGFEGDYGNEYGSEFGDDGMGDQSVGAGEFGDDYGADEAGATQRRRRMVRHHRMHRPQPSARQQAIHAHRLRSSRAVVSKGYTKSRVQSIGFESLQIAPHSSADIPTKPQVLFRGTRLIVGSAIAQFFTIDDIKVGMHVSVRWRRDCSRPRRSRRPRPGRMSLSTPAGPAWTSCCR